MKIRALADTKILMNLRFMGKGSNSLFVLGAILIGLGDYIWWAHGDRAEALWVGAAGSILLFVAATFQIQHHVRSSRLRALAAGRGEAYVFIDGSRVRNLDGPDPVVAELTIKNHGPVAAHDLVHWGGVALLDFPLGSEQLNSPRQGKPLSRQRLAPNRELFDSIPFRSLTGDERRALKSGASALYVFGEITYRDPAGAWHATKYLLFVGGRAGFRGEQMAVYPDGNHAA